MSNRPDIRVEDKNGEQFRLNARQRNALYRQAKDLREGIKDSLCTRTECWRPTEENVDKMMRREQRTKKEQVKYRKIMKALGADPEERDIERLRKGR